MEACRCLINPWRWLPSGATDVDTRKPFSAVGLVQPSVISLQQLLGHPFCPPTVLKAWSTPDMDRVREMQRGGSYSSASRECTGQLEDTPRDKNKTPRSGLLLAGSKEGCGGWGQFTQGTKGSYRRILRSLALCNKMVLLCPICRA